MRFRYFQKIQIVLESQVLRSHLSFKILHLLSHLKSRVLPRQTETELEREMEERSARMGGAAGIGAVID